MIIAKKHSEQFPLRFPDGLRAHIKAQAQTNGRSMNSEIIYQLQKAYKLNEAAGEEIGVQAPAAKHKTDAETSAC